MDLLEELRDPWGLVMGMAAGVGAWALGLGPAISAGVAVGAFLVKIAVALLLDRQAGRRSRSPAPETAGAPAQRRWLERGRWAAGTALEAMHRLASQVGALDITIGQLDPDALAGEERRLVVELEQARDSEIRLEIERSLSAVREQLALRARLEQGRRTLIAKMESGTLELERLVARLAEALVTTAAPARARTASRTVAKPGGGRPPG